MSFDRTIRHCRQCGHPVAKRLPDDGDTRERDICTVCNTVHYINPLNVVGTAEQFSDAAVQRKWLPLLLEAARELRPLL